MKIKIVRTSYNSSSITGEMFVDNVFLCHTLELPWHNNESYVSSIPPGVYRAFIRYDKPDGWRLQFIDVPGGRTGVQIHMGNYPTQIEGCVLVGRSVKNAANAVLQSAEAYDELRSRFYGSSHPIATPDVNLEVSIQYYNGRTEYIVADIGVFLKYIDMSKWTLYSFGDPVSMIETQRDQQYIYLESIDAGPKAYIKIALFGGDVFYSDTGREGDWGASAGPVTRNN